LIYYFPQKYELIMNQALKPNIMINSFFEALFLFGNKGKTITNTFASENSEARTVTSEERSNPACSYNGLLRRSSSQ
jgi:hypothetical protein